MSALPDAVPADAGATILVVDDVGENLALMADLLRAQYRVLAATSGQRALAIARSQAPPDLILLDVMMPGMDGYEVCRALKGDARTCDIPVIFLTARTDGTDEERGLALGAVDYITKPISPPIVLARTRTHLSLKASADALRDRGDVLEREVARRTRELQMVQDVTILAMASLAETRDIDTGLHIRRTQHYVRALAEHLRPHPRFSAFLTDANIVMLFRSAALHDIGKVGIPDRILLKPGRLTPEEFEVMKTHTTLGYEAIVGAERALGVEVPFLRMAKEIALSHQEKWDGSGYPQGLRGEAIPIAARLMALADVYDALVTRRVYRAPIPHDEVVGMIADCAGSHFDPDMVTAFVEIQDRLREIAVRYADATAAMMPAATGDTAAMA